MRNLLKNTLRYVFKNKFSMLGLFILLFIAVAAFTMFSNLSNSMFNSYTNLVNSGNMHNIVIYDKWSDVPSVAEENKEKFYQDLKEMGVEHREFNSLNVTNGSNQSLYKVIEYKNTYKIDTLDVFNDDGLPLDSQGKPTLPTGINYNIILDAAGQNLPNQNNSATYATTYTQSESITARQMLVYFASNAAWGSTPQFGQQFKEAWKLILQNPNIDPVNDPTFSSLTGDSQKVMEKVSSYVKGFVVPNNNPTVPPMVRGARITFTMDKWNNNIPSTGYFDDPSSYLAIVSPKFVEDNGKEIFNFNDYRKEIGNTSSFPLHPTSIEDLSTTMPSTDEFIDNWLANIDDKYKVYVNNIPYLIVGTGITPDFMYPIISFESVIPNPEKEALVYTNYSGYNRSEFSFSTSPHESFIVAKYNGPKPLDEVVKEINVLATKYMAWPSNITPAYVYNDKANQMSPSALRVSFVTELVTAINGVSMGLSVFIIILALFVIGLFARRFVQQNKTTIAILISNGTNKMKVLASIATIGLVPCIIAGALGFMCGFFLQTPAFGMFSQYWMIPTPMEPFNVGWLFFAIIVPTIVFIVMTFAIGMWLLRDNLVTLLKEDVTVKVGFFANVAKAVLSWGPIMLKFRGSLAFSSIAKMFFLVLMTSVAGIVITFVVSTTGKLQEANENDKKTNVASFAINLFTPTIQGGQYKAVDMPDLGRMLHANHDSNDSVITDQGYKNNLFYMNAWNNSPFFREYASMHWPSATDSSDYQNNILYLNNKTEVQSLIDNKFGVGSMATIPWNVPKAMMPTDQINGSLLKTKEYNTRLMTDMRPFNEAYFFNTQNNPSKKGVILPDASNSVLFPTTWAIQNFNTNPTDWKLSYGQNAYSEQYGVISAPEITGFNSPEEVASMSAEQIANAINSAYNTYGTEYMDSDFPTGNDEIMKVKYYPGQLFKADAISNIRIDPTNPNVVLFDVNRNKNGNEYLLTTRSIFKQYFEKQITVNQNTDLTNVTFDPFANTESVGYIPNESNVTGIIAVAYKNNFINFFLHSYIDPAYQEYFYRIIYNQFLYNTKDDEPYTYIEANVDNKVGKNDSVTIQGIMPNSRFVKLVDRKHDSLNDLLFTQANNIVVNEYAARKYNLKVGDTFKVTPTNTIWRYKINNPTDILKNPNAQLDLYEPWATEFKVVGINNSGHNAQFFTSMESAQNILGLATKSQYENDQDVSQWPTKENGYNIDVGMNNQWDRFGGFNGVFTASPAPYVLTSNLSLYSPSGLYPGNDSWEQTQLMFSLFKNTLTKYPDKVAYLANALNMTYDQFNTTISQMFDEYKASNSNDKSTEWQKDVDFIKYLSTRLMDVLTELYGKMTLVSVNSSANALMQQATMFDSISSTFDQIEGVVSALVIVLSMIIVILLSWMIILDMLKLVAILKTLGYSDISNAWNFFCIFIPTWLISFAITIPFTMLALNIFQTFIFANVGVFVLAPFNWWAFILVELGIALLFTIIFFVGMSFFKRINIVEVLKW